jgi:hypothetical protein
VESNVPSFQGCLSFFREMELSFITQFNFNSHVYILQYFCTNGERQQKKPTLKCCNSTFPSGSVAYTFVNKGMKFMWPVSLSLLLNVKNDFYSIDHVNIIAFLEGGGASSSATTTVIFQKTVAS